MTNKFKIVLSFLSVLIASLVCGLVVFAINSNTYKKNNEIDARYEIMIRENYEVYVGERFELTPNLIKNGQLVADADFTFVSDDADITVSSDGLVTVGARESGTAHITVSDARFDIAKVLTLRIINELYSVSGILSANDEYINDSQLYEIGKEYSYSVAALPQVVAISQYTEVSCVDEAGNISNSLDVRYDGKNIFITPRCIGTGHIVLNIVNPNRNVDYEESIPFACYFKESAINESILSGHERSLVSRSELNGLTQLVMKEEADEISLDELTMLSSLKRVVFTGDEVIDIIGTIPSDYVYRVKGKDLFFNYLHDEHWKSVYNNIIYYEKDYNEKYVIYHTDNDHPVAGFENGINIVAWGGELIYDYESIGYDAPIWKSGYGENETVVANRDLRNLSDGVHVYADWTPHTYIVTFEDYNVGFNEEMEIKYLAIVDGLNEFAPTKDGYSFDGWYFDEDYAEPFTAGYTYELTHDICVYAKYSTNIRLDYDGGSDTGKPDYIDAIYNKPIVLPAIENESGWTFNGWYTSRGGYRGQKIDPDAPYVHEGEQSLYAVWSCVIPIEFSESDFSEFKSTGLKYIHGLTMKELFNMNGDPLLSREEYINIYNDGSWTFNGLYTDNNEAADKNNTEIKLTPSSVLRADFVSSVSFEYAHGSKVKNVPIHYGGKLTFVSDEWGNFEGKPSAGLVYEPGYTYKGWTLDPDDSSAQLITSSEEYSETVGYAYANRTYFAQYEIIEYTITFETTKELDPNCTAVGIKGYTYTVEDNEIVLPEFVGDLELEGYLGNWIAYNVGGGYVRFEAENNKWKIPSGVIGDMTIRGLYAAKAYFLHYKDYAGNDVAYSSEIKYGQILNESAYNVTPSCPANYTFDGWYSDSNYESEWQFGKKYDSSCDTTLYAKYSMEVKFKSGLVADGTQNNGFGGSTATTNELQYKVVYGNELPFPVMESHEWSFYGWVDISFDKAPDFVYDFDTNTIIGNKEFKVYNYSESEKQSIEKEYKASTNSYYAVWVHFVDLITGTEKITFKELDKNDNILAVHGLTLEHTCSANVFDGSILNYGEYSAWRFLGWYNGKGKEITGNDVLIDIAPLHAKFQAEATFKNGNEVETVNVILGEPLSQFFHDEKLTGFAQSVQAGYKLAWEYKNANYYPDSDEVVDIEACNTPFTLVGIPIRYTIRFISDAEAQGMPSEVTIDYEQSNVSVDKPSRTGYNFTGWKYNENTYKDLEVLPNTLTTVDNAVIDFSATWKAKEYTIQLDSNGGSSNSSPVPPVAYNEIYKMPDDFTKAGYDLVGWSFDKNVAAVYNVGANVEVSALEPNSDVEGNITLYAQWKAIHYTVVYDFGVADLARAANSGENNASVDVEYNSNESLYASVMRSGYEFIGWRDGNGNTYKAGDPISNLTEQKEEVRLTAIWEPIPCSINYTITTTPDGESVTDSVVVTFDDWTIIGGYSNEYVDGGYKLYLREESELVAKNIYVPGSTTPVDGQYYYWELDELANTLVSSAQKAESLSETYKVTAMTAYVAYKVEFTVNDVTVKTVYYSVSPTDGWDNLKDAPTEYFKKFEPDANTLEEVIGEGATVASWNYGNIPQSVWTLELLGDYKVTATLEQAYTLTVNSASGIEQKLYTKLYSKDGTDYYPLNGYAFAVAYENGNFTAYERDAEADAVLIPYLDNKNIEVYASTSSKLPIKFYVYEQTVEAVSFDEETPMLYKHGYTYTATLQPSASTRFSVYSLEWTPQIEKPTYTITYLDQYGSKVGESEYTEEDLANGNLVYKAPAVPTYQCRHGDITHADRYIAEWNYESLSTENMGDVVIYPVYTPKIYAVEYIAYASSEDYNHNEGYIYEYGWYTDVTQYRDPSIPRLSELGGQANWSTHYDGFDFVDGKTTQVYVTYDDFAVSYFDPFGKGEFMDDHPDLAASEFITTIRVSKDSESMSPGVENMPSHKGYRVKSFYAYDYRDNKYITIDDTNYSKVYDSGLQTQNGAICIYIEWEPIEVTVTFNANGGDGEEITVVNLLRYGDCLSERIGNIVFPTKFGYHLLGYTTQDGNKYQCSTTDGTQWISDRWDIAGEVPEDIKITLFAQWEENTYNVTLDVNGGEVIHVQYDDLISNIPTKTGYHLLGYTLTQNGTAYYLENIATDKQNNTVQWKRESDINGYKSTSLFAKWEANTYTVTFNFNGGQGSNTTLTVQYDSLISDIPLPTKTGHHLLGYTLTQNGTDNYLDNNADDQQNNVQWEEGRTWNITEDTVLYAQWGVNFYTLTATHDGYSKIQVTVNPDNTDGNGRVAYGAKVSVTYGYANGGDKDLKCSVDGATATYNGNTAEFTMPAKSVIVSVTAGKKSGGSCFVAGSLISMPDGTQKKVENLTLGEEILTFNHFTGAFDKAPVVILFAMEVVNYPILNLTFANGTVVKVVNAHGFFDLTLNEYVMFDYENAISYIGHSFFTAQYRGTAYTGGATVLVSADVTYETTMRYTLVTAEHIDHVVNGLLAVSDETEGLFNVFAYDENMRYDGAQMQEDIARYGLADYKEWSDYITYEEFLSFGGQYINVALGKGLTTREKLIALIETYVRSEWGIGGAHKSE